MPWTTEARNQMLDSQLGTGPNSGTWAALCRTDPGTSYGQALAAELVGAPYARKQLNLNAAALGQKTLAALPVFDVPAGNSIGYIAYWRVSGGGVQSQYLGSAQLAAPESYGNNGQYTLTDETWQLAPA